LREGKKTGAFIKEARVKTANNPRLPGRTGRTEVRARGTLEEEDLFAANLL